MPPLAPVDVVDHQAALEQPGPVHEHIWANASGRPLICGMCGEVWPGDEPWPPGELYEADPEIRDWRQA